MAHSYGGATARTSSVANPITVSVQIAPGTTILGVLLKVVGATNRAGGSLTWGPYTLTQANTTQKAAASPEASCEAWYLLNPEPGTNTLTIPNTGALTVVRTIVTASAKPGSKSALDGVAGANGTSTNPAPGAVVTTENGDIGFAITATGAQTWAPSAQAGTVIANTDDGADGSGEQYLIQSTKGSIDLGWTFGTSDDWGAVAMFFKEVGTWALENYHVDRIQSSGLSVAK